MDLVTAYDKWTHLLQKMSQNKCHECIKLEEHIKLAKEIKKYKEEVNALQFELSNEALLQMPEFQGRIDILKEIGYIDEDLVVQIKGRVACEMNSGEELICTECLFENQLDDLEPEEAVALMSAFVFQQKNTSEPSLTSKLSQAKQRLYDTAIRLGDLQAEFKLPITPEEYAQENLKFGLVEVVYEWAKAQDHLLGVVLKSSSANNKQYIVLLLKPDVPSMTQSPSDRSNLQDKKGADFDQGYVLPPKSKRGLEEDYRISAGPRKGSGIINITLPHHGAAAGVTFEVREAENTEFLCICTSKIKLDLPGLLEFVSNAAFSHTVQQLLKLKSNGNKYPPALDPKGTPFADICELTDVPEGLIVRTIVRLDETCREFKTAAAIMGNSSLYKKMESASNAIKRDIVFAASLYITGV
ncbi:hypothetical protein GOBAR_DD13328 [Gossypium barbadense]|nr:hypothetical protein GOBAR_DD13328 [Gossypium barbadense]